MRIWATGYGYTLKEIADHLQIHYTTVSKVLTRKAGDEKWYFKTPFSSGHVRFVNRDAWFEREVKDEEEST